MPPTPAPTGVGAILGGLLGVPNMNTGTIMAGGVGRSVTPLVSNSPSVDGGMVGSVVGSSPSVVGNRVGSSSMLTDEHVERQVCSPSTLVEDEQVDATPTVVGAQSKGSSLTGLA